MEAFVYRSWIQELMNFTPATTQCALIDCLVFFRRTVAMEGPQCSFIQSCCEWKKEESTFLSLYNCPATARQPTMCSEPVTSVPSKGHLVVAVDTGSGVLGIILDGN